MNFRQINFNSFRSKQKICSHRNYLNFIFYGIVYKYCKYMQIFIHNLIITEMLKTLLFLDKFIEIVFHDLSNIDSFHATVI